jgi:hypothetical protein
MAGVGKCPGCQKQINHTKLDSITVGDQAYGPRHRGVSVICPYCDAILGAAIDPVSLKAEIVDEILTALGKKPKRQ